LSRKPYRSNELLVGLITFLNAYDIEVMYASEADKIPARANMKYKIYLCALSSACVEGSFAGRAGGGGRYNVAVVRSRGLALAPSCSRTLQNHLEHAN